VRLDEYDLVRAPRPAPAVVPAGATGEASAAEVAS
jgi:hypothetical protein